MDAPGRGSRGEPAARRGASLASRAVAVGARARAYFEVEQPTFWVAMLPLLVLAAALYTRPPGTNFIFDEQEALLANPWVNGHGLWRDVVHVDFWGLPANRSIGSYRPLPDLAWRLLASGMRATHDLATRLTHGSSTFQLGPWAFHWLNVVLHATNGALLTSWVWGLTRRRAVAWLAGLLFVGCAVLTEAVSGVVGTADVMGGLGALLALLALQRPLWAMGPAVFASLLFGLFSKESALVCVPLVPLAALWLAPVTHPRAPRRVARALVALAASAAAFVLYVELRKRWFPAPLPPELTDALPASAGRLGAAARAALVWFHQPPLPKDPLNNPFVHADVASRFGGALRVFASGLGQVLAPWRLSGDYSFPAEPVPPTTWFPASALGLAALVGLPLAGLATWALAALDEWRARARGRAVVVNAEPLLVALGLVWIVVSYFPHSNIPAVLPTVRAERFWYFPAIGSSCVLACAFAWLAARAPRLGALAFGAFFALQCGKARAHALDYADDLVFWRATREAAPRSAKAHLNYSVMEGARGRLDVRLEANRVALDLAPRWPMAHIYLGDTLCRLHRAEEAWPHYVRGFELADNDTSLVSLALQCLWDEGAAMGHKDELEKLAEAHPGSWLSFLATDLVQNGEAHGGVDPQYRPRGYNEGPKE